MLSLLACFTLAKVVSEYLCNQESSCGEVLQLKLLENTVLFHGESRVEHNCMVVMVLGIREIKRLRILKG